MSHLEVNLAGLDAIIFDLGGVIINLCYEKSIEQLGQLAVQDWQQLYAQATQVDLFEQYETGQITSREFRDGVRSLLNMSNITDEQLDAAWNAMLLDIPVGRLEQLRVLGQTHRTF